MKTSLCLSIILIALESCQLKQQQRSGSADAVKTISIKQARAMPLGSEVTIEGTITVASGSFSSSIPYGYALQDDTAGIYVIDSVPPMEGEYNLGEMAEVSGFIEETNKLLVIREAKAIKKGVGNLISVITVKTGNVDEDTEGMIVKTSGVIDSLITDLPYGLKIYIDDGSGNLTIFVNTSTGLLTGPPLWSVADSISVIGFSGQYNTAYEVEPRNREDFFIFDSK